MTVALLGNPSPMMQVKVPTVTDEQDVVLVDTSVPAQHLNQSVTRCEMRPLFDDPEDVERALSTDNDRMLIMIARNLPEDLRVYAVGVLEVEQIMAVHSAGTAPTWVDVEDQADIDFARALSEHFRCPIGEPTLLLTNLGRDDLHSQHLGTAVQPAAYNHIGLTANSTAPSAANTSLPAEITTAGGGLIRKQATFAHTAGTNTSTLTATFTTNGSDVLPVVIAKIGVFKHITTAATMGYETMLNATATLNVVGDSVTITETVTGG